MGCAVDLWGDCMWAGIGHDEACTSMGMCKVAEASSFRFDPRDLEGPATLLVWALC